MKKQGVARFHLDMHQLKLFQNSFHTRGIGAGLVASKDVIDTAK